MSNHLTDQTWHIYRVASADLKGWRSFGIKHEQIIRAEDMSAIAGGRWNFSCRPP